MQGCSLIRKCRKRGPIVGLLRRSDKSTSGKRIYRKRVIGTVEEYFDADSARRSVAGLIERINAVSPTKHQDYISRILDSPFTTCEEQLREDPWRDVRSVQPCLSIRTL